MAALLSILIPQLREPSSSIKLTTDQESWIATIFMFSFFPSQFVSGVLSEKYGPRIVLAASLIPFMISSIALRFAGGFAAFFAAFMMAGLIGGGALVGPMLIAEICSPKYRGILLNLKMVIVPFGVVFPHYLGYFYNWRTLSLYVLIPCTCGLLTTLTCPDSPVFLAKSGKFEESRAAFVWFRGDEDSSELQQLLDNQRQVLKRLKANRNTNQFQKIYKLIFEKGFLKSAAISIACIIAFESAGKQVLVVYASDFLASILGTKQNFYLFATIYDLIDGSSALMSCYMVQKISRKSLIIGTGVPSIIVLCMFCLSTYLFSKNVIPSDFSWVSVALMITFMIVSNIGILPTLVTVMSEIYPISHRGFGISFNSFAFAFILGVQIKVTPILLKSCGVYGLFLLNAVAMSLSLLYLHIFSPETDKKSLQNIEKELEDTSIDLSSELNEVMLSCSNPLSRTK